MRPDRLLESFADLQESAAAELRTKGVFVGLAEHILVGDPLHLEAEIDQTVAQLKGLAILVEPPRGANTKPQIFGALHLGDVTFPVTIAEAPLLNRGEGGTGITALRAVLEVMRALHGYRLPGTDVMLQALGWEPVTDPELVAHRATFRTSLTLPLNADLRER